MKNFRQSLLTLTLLITAIMTTSFRVQNGVPFLTSQEIIKDANNYRSIATLKDQQKEPIIIQLNVRITKVISVRNIISADRVLLEKLMAQSTELKEQIAINDTSKNSIQDLKVMIVDLEKEISSVTQKLQANISELEEEKTALQSDLENTQSSNEDLQTKIDFLKEEFESQTSLTQGEIDNANSVIEGLNSDLEVSKGELVAKEEAFQKLEQENCLKEKKISELQNEISVAIQDKEDVMTALTELEEELSNLEDEDSDANDDSDDSTSIADATTQTEMQTLVAAFSGVMTSQMQFIQQMQAQNQEFMMSQMLSQMGPVDTATSSLERYLMYTQRGGVNNFGFGGYSMPMSLDLAPQYSHFLSQPQYSSYPEPYIMAPHFNQGIPNNISFGGGRAPAVTGSAPIFLNGAPTHLN